MKSLKFENFLTLRNPLEISKRAQVDPLKVIVSAVILLVVMAVILFVFTDLFGESVGVARDQITGSQDFDGDGTMNMFDKCPCNADEEPKEGKCTKDKGVCKKEMEDYYKALREE